jgi:cephalosporin-C deacetylase-like acetyl esterase
MKCSRIVHGFGYGGDMGFAADLKLPNFGWAKLKARLRGLLISAIV